MFESTHRILELLGALGEISGRKKLQKIVYILNSQGHDISFDFRYHQYGPYSAELQSELNRLAASGLVSEQIINNTYCYAISESGKNVLEFLEDRGLGASSKLVIPFDLLKLLSSCDAQLLELVATIIYVRRLGLTGNDLKSKIYELKPHLFSRYSEAEDVIEKIEKVNTASSLSD